MNYFFVDYENVKNQGLEGVDRLESTDTVIVFYSQNANTMTIDTHHSLCRSKADIRFERVNVGPKNALDFQLATYLGYVIGKTNDYSSKYFLVTKDAGFGVIGKFWRKESVDFTVIGKIADAFAQNKILELKKAENEVFIDDILPLDKQTVIENEEESFDETAEEVTAEENITQENEITAETAETEAAATEENAAEEQPVQKTEQSETMESRLFEVLQNESDVAAVVKIVGSYKTKSGINNAIVKSYHTQSGEIYKAIKPYIKDKKGSEPKNAEPEPKSELAAALEDVLTNPR
ncbi:MAG: hypothetical protein IJR59_06765, partial [Firmicutes bacterium]|nr:hypothetical protein [Bacillota bacterium]